MGSKFLKRNPRIEITTIGWGKDENAQVESSITYLKDIVKEIERHVDGVDSMHILTDDFLACEFCHHPWEVDEEDMPLCCSRAQDEFEFLKDI